MLSQRKSKPRVQDPEAPDIPVFQEELQGFPSIQARDKHNSKMRSLAAKKEINATQKAYQSLEEEHHNVRNLENTIKDLNNEMEIITGFLLAQLQIVIDITEKNPDISEADRKTIDDIKKNMKQALAKNQGDPNAS